MNLVTLDGVAKHIGDRVLFADVATRINAGDRLGLIGVNGCGKSTLLRMVAGLESPDAGTVTIWGGVRVQHLAQEPRIDGDATVLGHLFRGRHPQMQRLREYRAATHLLADAPDDTALQARVAELVAELDRTDGWAAEARARTVLTRLGIVDHSAHVSTLSGGQRKRVALARALLEPADLLVLDEPTNHLDAEAVAWLEEYLLAVPSALVMVTHDRYFLERIVNGILEIDRRELVRYPGNYRRYLELRSARHDRLAAQEARRQKLLRRELEWLRRAPKARTTKQRARSQRVDELMQLEVDRGEQRVAIALGGRRLGDRVLEARDLWKAYDGKPVLSGIDVDLVPGQRIGIVGPNGAGKSTLLDVLAGRVAPDRGTVAWGETVELAYFDQRSGGLEDDRRVIDVIEERAPLIVSHDGERVTAARMLEWFLFDGARQHTLVGSLSGGERRRLYLLWTLVHRPNVLFFDEPTNDLDLPTLGVLETFLDHFQGALVVVSHDRYFLDRTVDELLEIADGRFGARHPAPYATFDRLRREAAPSPSGMAAAVRDDARASRPDRVTPASDARRQTRPSYKDRRELAAIETRIGELEARRADLERDMRASVADYVRLEDLHRALAEVDGELDDLLPRWIQLSDARPGSGAPAPTAAPGTDPDSA